MQGETVMGHTWMELLAPFWISSIRKLGGAGARERIRAAVFLSIGALFWILTFWVFWRVLAYFRGIESLGDLLAAKLLSMIFLTFFALLVFSNIITALSTFFLSDDLELLLAAPVRLTDVYLAKLAETLVGSSWMLLLFGTPVFIVYGLVFHADWPYYVSLAAVLPPFLLIPAVMGAAAVMGIANLFPARKARDILIFLALLFGVGLYLLLRMLQPERLANPEIFSGVLSYLASLRSPSHPLLPSYWITQVIVPHLFRMPGSGMFYLGMLWSTAGAFAVMGGWLAKKAYMAGWSKSQEGRAARGFKSIWASAATGLVDRVFPANMQPLVEKDVKIFFRNPAQWSQLFLLGALIVVYLYNFSVLPIEETALGAWYLKHLLAFLNTGLAGFVLAAVAVRFVFPAVSLEGNAFWVLRSSPLSAGDVLWAKFWGSLLPLVLISGVLVAASNWMLRVNWFMMGLSVITILLCTLGVTGLGVGMGAMYPRFRAENAARISSGFGGMLFMLISIGFVCVVVLMEAFPVMIVFRARFRHVPIHPLEYVVMGLCLFCALALMGLAFYLPMKKGIEALDRLEM